MNEAESALAWLHGSQLTNSEKKDFTWFFRFEGGGTIATESIWRLITPEKVVVTSEDHGQMFGLPEPVGAEKRLHSTLQNQRIARVVCSEPHCDLFIHFENEAQLQFFNMSSGFESWRAQQNLSEVICMGGGGVTIF